MSIRGALSRGSPLAAVGPHSPQIWPERVTWRSHLRKQLEEVSDDTRPQRMTIKAAVSCSVETPDGNSGPFRTRPEEHDWREQNERRKRRATVQRLAFTEGFSLMSSL